MNRDVQLHGRVDPSFEPVRDAFVENFTERGELGASCCVFLRGVKVVDLWAGWRDRGSSEPWRADTMTIIHSTSKGLAAMVMALAHSRRWIDYDERVATYWPEFAQNGKEYVTVRQLLGHEAGLVWLDEELPLSRLRDLDYVARVLARQKPAWPPGTRRGYHAMTVGLYMQEILRRVDPKHRTLGRFFDEEIAAPLHLDFYIGLPAEIPDRRLAKLVLFSPTRALRALPSTPGPLAIRVLWPWSLLRRSLLFADMNPNDRSTLELELPAGNGVGTARAIARLYSVFAEGGGELGVGPETLARLTASPPDFHTNDVVIGVPSSFSLGFMKPGPELAFGSSPRAFGMAGAGGSFGFADPDQRLGFAYVMNKMDFHLLNDPRERALREAVQRAIVARERAAPRRPAHTPEGATV